MQSFQPGNKVRIHVFQAVLLAFFVSICGQAFAQTAKTAGTTTSLAVTTQDTGSRTQATFDVSVAGQGSTPGGTVSLMNGDTSIGSAVLDAAGQAKLTVDALPNGVQKIVAVYNGDSTHATSQSSIKAVSSATTGVADYTLTANPSSLTSITAGQTASTTLTVTPENGFNQYVSFSCSGLPSVTSCTFTPATISTASGSAVSTTLVIQTTAVSGTGTAQLKPAKSNGLYYAMACPGILALVGLVGFKKRWHFAGKLMTLAVFICLTMGLSSCAARYNYYNHGPAANGGTPSGTYTVTVTASSDNGLAETSHALDLTLTIK